MQKKKKFVIIDGHALIHRAWHAIPPLTAKDGRLVNAVFGFTSVLLKALSDLKPDFAAVAFDLPGPTFRHEKYQPYKATRVKQADELYEQIPLIKQVVRSFNINIFEKPGFEADDLIGTLCDKRQVDRADVLSVIVTGDLDTLQLVDDNTEVFTLKRGITETVIYNAAAIKERFGGLRPDQIIDYKALRGDPSDNIPGVKGIGEKTAIELLRQFENLDNLYHAVETDSAAALTEIKPRIRGLLIDHKPDAYLSRELATIKRDVKIDFDLNNCAVKKFDSRKVLDLFSELGFRSLFNRLPSEPDAVEESSEPAAGERVDYLLIDSGAAFDKFFSVLINQDEFCFDTETTGLDIFNDRLLGLSFCWRAGQAYYVVNRPEFLAKLKTVFENHRIRKIAQNMKFDASILRTAGVNLKNYYFDTMIASYLMTPGTRSHGLDNLAFTELKHRMIPITDLIGAGREQINMADVPLDKLSYYSCEDADFTFRLYQLFKPRLTEQKLDKVFYDIEMPLIEVLIEMEFNGIKLDIDQLKTLGVKVNAKIKKIEQRIYDSAGREFNISSPKQLKEILFDQLDIPIHGLKKTKTGISTAASELDKMKDLHPIIKMIGEYRELTKLKSTYIDALPKLVRQATGRIHTSFNQTITATGRLSSSEPNLQNIPIRTELGREIRRAFIAERGNLLIAADYSQVELRVIACLAKDENMMAVFNQGKDIHSATAAKIFDVPLDQVTKDQRRKAKEVNFGVLYGMGAGGLAQRTGISRAEAREFIDKYFDNYQAVKKYTDQMVETARTTQEVETLFGRKRRLPDINSNVPVLRAAAERMAVNMPIQGTAADLMKIAMIEVFRELKKISPESKLLLQVHDELVIECPADQVKKIAKIIDDKMEKIHQLCVPIKVDTEVGKNWDEMGEGGIES